MSTKKSPLAKRACAYEGCEKLFAVPREGRPKKYCCDLHRALASRERRREAAIPPGRSLAFNAELPGAGEIPHPELPFEPPLEQPTGAAPSGVTLHTQTTGAHRNFGHAGAQTIIHVHERLVRRTTYGPGEEVHP